MGGENTTGSDYYGKIIWFISGHIHVIGNKSDNVDKIECLHHYSYLLTSGLVTMVTIMLTYFYAS